ncbi:MAG: NUDIX domain-containing protein [Bdellovibrionales bacterium]|nr:NUDIX domain-containing protein [Bdellovibrionales bacterium]
MNTAPLLRPNVCILLYNAQKKLFLGERCDCPGEWQFPQGGVEGDCSLEENVIREIEEEIGVSRDLIRVARRLRATHEYEWKEPREYGDQTYRGQTQTFWLVEFLGNDSDINLNTPHPEFMDWKWCASKEIPNIAHKQRLAGYILPLREFEDFLMLEDTGLLE